MDSEIKEELQKVSIIATFKPTSKQVQNPKYLPIIYWKLLRFCVISSYFFTRVLAHWGNYCLGQDDHEELWNVRGLECWYPGDRPDISKGYNQQQQEERAVPATVTVTMLGQHLDNICFTGSIITRKQLFFGLQTGHLSSDLYLKSGNWGQKFWQKLLAWRRAYHRRGA